MNNNTMGMGVSSANRRPLTVQDQRKLLVGKQRHASKHGNTGVLSVLPHDISFLHQFGIGLPVLISATRNARRHNISAAQAIIRSGGISESDYFRCAANVLGLSFVEHTPMTAEPFYDAPTADTLKKMALMVPVDGVVRMIHIAPDMRHMNALKSLLYRHPSLKLRLRVCTRTSNLTSLENRSKTSLLRLSTQRLANGLPHFSAKSVITVNQAVVLLLILQTLAVFLIFADSVLLLTLHIIATLFYLSCVVLRLYACASVDFADRQKRSQRPLEIERSADGDLPVYSVLVALYQEESQVPGLVSALLKLDWPREKLEIKLICEADDSGTIDAVQTAIARAGVHHIKPVLVPAQHPRTKPKALNYALPLCHGRLLVIYDAEDKPHPLQLREAHKAFVNGPQGLVCLQAPLIIHNHAESWLSCLFAIEYSSLFDGLLPALATRQLMLPLGGTSNHIKREALERAEGWDPYNVTEDADLGVRFARMGFLTDTLVYPTYEEAPIAFSVWVKQRTRWFKGWLQTWLVHMRNPAALSRDLGFANSLAFHVVITGMIISALVHPILLYFIVANIWKANFGGADAILSSPMFWLDCFTVFLGYSAFALLAYKTLPVRNLQKLFISIWTLPIYWMLLSIGAWRAVWHLIRRPHEWEKTPHRLADSHTIGLHVNGNVSKASGPAPDSLTLSPHHKAP